ncbi:hypothetical protein Halar_0697 (plasmid) [halophilic archaeon DL31]|jgi:hypothetical protein|nr:hypothetical protein Halar_0697 [halophilic archaeon DL31]
MTGLKKGTGGLDFDDDSDQEEVEAELEAEAESESESVVDSDPEPEKETDSEPESAAERETDQSPAQTQAQGGDLDMDDLPYLVRRQMRGASVNADRTKQLLLEVRPFVKDGEEDFLNELRDLVDGPVYKGDAREAAMIVAQEHPELVADKLREWGIEYLDK